MATFYAFCLGSQERKLAVVYRDGTFLANRWEEQQGMNLYHRPAGFFAELYDNNKSSGTRQSHEKEASSGRFFLCRLVSSWLRAPRHNAAPTKYTADG